MVANRIIYLLLHEAYIEIAKEHPIIIFYQEMNRICLLNEAEGLCKHNPKIPLFFINKVLLQS